MKILCIYQFFSTGRTPDSLRPFRFCKLLAEIGHQVIVLSTDFNRHSGELEGPKEEIIPTKGKSLQIFRLPSTRKYRKGLVYRFMNYMGFAIQVLWKGFQISGVDIVITSLPPIFVGPVGWLLAAHRRKPFFLEVRDLWPDALEVKGAVKSRLFLRPLYALSDFLYRKACFIVTVTYGIKEELVKKGIDPESIAVLPNGVDPELFQNKIDRDEVRRKWGWNNDFVAIYIGTLVEVTSVDTIIEAAEKLKGYPEIRVEIFGSGSTASDLEKRISEKHLTNCRLNGTVGKEKVPSLLGASDVCLMCLFETPLAHIYLQNKLFDYMGAGKPIVAALRGHQRAIIEHVDAGICVDPKDSTGLATAILALANNLQRCREMGGRSQYYAMKHFCLDDILNQYAELVTACAEGKKPVVALDSDAPFPFYPDTNL